MDCVLVRRTRTPCSIQRRFVERPDYLVSSVRKVWIGVRVYGEGFRVVFPSSSVHFRNDSGVSIDLGVGSPMTPISVTRRLQVVRSLLGVVSLTFLFLLVLGPK